MLTPEQRSKISTLLYTWLGESAPDDEAFWRDLSHITECAPEAATTVKLTLREIGLLKNLDGNENLRLLSDGSLVLDMFQVDTIDQQTTQRLYELGYLDVNRRITDAGRKAVQS